MSNGQILIPRGTLDSAEMEMIASKLFKIGYAVRKVTVSGGQHKGAKIIEYWIDGGEDSVRKCEAGGSKGRPVGDGTVSPDTR